MLNSKVFHILEPLHGNSLPVLNEVSNDAMDNTIGKFPRQFACDGAGGNEYWMWVKVNPTHFFIVSMTSSMYFISPSALSPAHRRALGSAAEPVGLLVGQNRGVLLQTWRIMPSNIWLTLKINPTSVLNGVGGSPSMFSEKSLEKLSMRVRTVLWASSSV